MKTSYTRMRVSAISFVVASGMIMSASPADAACAMQNQMQTASQTTLQSRLTSIDSNMQALALLNSLQTQCTQGLESVPTQLIGSGLIATTFINQIAQSVCSGLAAKVRSTATAAMAQAQAAVQQQINSAMSNVIKSAGGSGTLLGGVATSVETGLTSATNSTMNSAVNSLINSVTSIFK